MSWSFKILSWWETVVWFIFKKLQMSPTHISQSERQDRILRRVESARFWKKSARFSTWLWLGIYFLTSHNFLSLKRIYLFTFNAPFLIWFHINISVNTTHENIMPNKGQKAKQKESVFMAQKKTFCWKRKNYVKRRIHDTRHFACSFAFSVHKCKRHKLEHKLKLLASSLARPVKFIRLFKLQLLFKLQWLHFMWEQTLLRKTALAVFFY